MIFRILALVALLFTSSAFATTSYNTVPAWNIGGHVGSDGASGAAYLCTLYSKALTSYTPTNLTGYSGSVTVNCSGQTAGFALNATCPYGGSQVTAGGQCMNAPDCPGGQVRDTLTGVCGAPPCTAGESTNENAFAGWSICDKYSISCILGGAGGYLVPSSYCDGTCTVSVSGVQTGSCDANVGASVDSPKAISCIFSGTKTGAACSVNTKPVAGAAPVVPKTPAPCASGEGVMTTSAGKVVCVPSGTPGADNPPKVTKQSSTKNFPDGSTQVTTTTQTCTGEGACSSTTTITNTGPSGSPGTTGDAGKPGTSTEVKEKQPSETSSFCQQNPGLQLCKGGMNEEVTQKRVADALTVDAKDYTDITSADTAAAANAAKQAALDATTSAIGELSKIGSAADPAKAYQDQVTNALTNWFDPVPITGCQPVGGTIGGRTFSIDICPTAAKISEIGAYCLWIMFAFGTLALVTRKAE